MSCESCKKKGLSKINWMMVVSFEIFPQLDADKSMAISQYSELIELQESDRIKSTSSRFINGVTITPSYSGFVSQTLSISFVPSCGSSPINLITPLLFGQNSFIYSLSFSNPVNNVTIRLVNYRYTPTGTDSFTFTTNTGNPVITSCAYCCASIVGNVVTATQDLTNVYCNSTFGIGSGLFTITSSTPFTSLTISGPGNGLTAVYASICNFVAVLLGEANVND